MKQDMRIGYLMRIPLVLLILLALVSCTKNLQTMEGALAKNNIDFNKILTTEIIDKRALAFYKGEKDTELKMGLFELRKDGWHYLIGSNIDKELAESQQASLKTLDVESGFQGMKIPNFYLEYGIVHNQDIKTIKLTMADESGIKEINAKIISVGQERIWYIVRDNKKIYNLIQGIAEDGSIVFDSRPWLN